MSAVSVRSNAYRHHIPTKREYGQTYYSKNHFELLRTICTTLWEPTHDAICQVGGGTIEAGIKEHPLYVYAKLYNTADVAMCHPVSSFSIGSIGNTRSRPARKYRYQHCRRRGSRAGVYVLLNDCKWKKTRSALRVVCPAMVSSLTP